MRRIYRFLPVFKDTFNHTFVVSERSTVTSNGPYYCLFINMGRDIFYNFYGVTLPCTFTLYTRVMFAIGF